ncbi:alpha/beta hydrolase, partial [Mycolicibacterium smegmatis]
MSGLDPQIADIIEALDSGFPPVHTMTGAQARAAIKARFRPAAHPQPMAAVEDATATGSSGDVAVRIYRPATPTV